MVLFTSEYEGTVVAADDTDRLGEYNDGWVSCKDVKEWEIFTGQVVLEN